MTQVQVNAGTAVLTVCAFTVPTLTAYPAITDAPTDPAIVKLTWHFLGDAPTTWTYGTPTTHIAKLSTGVYYATISTKTAPTTRILGRWIGTAVCTVVVPFSITVTPT